MSEAKNVWERLFPPGPNFLRMLGYQLNHARKALDAFLQWCDHPDDSSVEAVFNIEREADDLRSALVLALTSAFETPLDREDINDLSQRLDDIVDQIRNTVREATALDVRPDEPIKQMIKNTQEGLVDLQHAIGELPRNRHGALDFAAKARHSHRLVERVYTRALADLLKSDDFRVIFRQREVYRQMIRLGEIVEVCGEELEHAINKLG